MASGITAGQVFIWPGRALYLGPLLDNDGHAHHALQVSVGLAGTLSLLAPPDRRWRRYRAVATAPDQPHRLRCGGPVAQIYLDPETSAGRTLRQQLGDARVQPADIGDAAEFAAAMERAGSGQPDPAELLRAIDGIIAGIAPMPRGRIDPRVQQALTAVHASAGRRAPLPVLAGQVHLSPSRLAALFRHDIGIPLRRYLLWLRLIDAVEALAAGADLTRAAHHAGFADSAHLSRTFRRMFGMPPAALQSQHVKLHDLAAGDPVPPSWTTGPAGALKP